MSLCGRPQKSSNDATLYITLIWHLIQLQGWGGRGWGRDSRHSAHLVVDEESESVLGVLKLQQALKEDGDEGCGLLDEDAHHHQRVLCLLRRQRGGPRGAGGREAKAGRQRHQAGLKARNPQGRYSLGNKSGQACIYSGASWESFGTSPAKCMLLYMQI